MCVCVYPSVQRTQAHTLCMFATQCLVGQGQWSLSCNLCTVLLCKCTPLTGCGSGRPTWWYTEGRERVNHLQYISSYSILTAHPLQCPILWANRGSLPGQVWQSCKFLITQMIFCTTKEGTIGVKTSSWSWKLCTKRFTCSRICPLCPILQW